MPPLRAAWTPVTPLALVLVLPLATLLALVPTDFLGTSGAVAALAGLLLSLSLRLRRRLPPAVRPRLTLHGLVALVIVGFAGALVPQVDNAAHLGGLVFGLLAGLTFAPSPAVQAALARLGGAAPLEHA